jgi:acetyl-CoA acetyltransferase family protein
MTTAVIVDAVRTPIAKRNGALAGWHPVDLAAVTLRALFDRTDLDPAAVDDVVMGCVNQVGEQAGNIARFSWLSAGLPETVAATTVDRQCGSSMQATHFAAQGVLAGAYDIAISCGVESMTRVPLGANVVSGPGNPLSSGLQQRYYANGSPGLMSQGQAADFVSDRWGLTRDALDDFGYESHVRAVRAQVEGRFEREIVPVPPKDGDGAPFMADDGPRADADREAMSRLAPAFTSGGKVTAGSSSQISDGASALLIMSEERAGQLGLTARARFVGFAVAGADLVEMMTAPIPATHKLLGKTGVSIDDIDLFEVNEAFATVPLVWSREVGADLERVNVNGGACALGHPLGATGSRMTATLLCELERTGGRYGLQTICEGGGLANATLIERLG